jgi:dolichyl-phosphate-mannose-protein mannosyltransferase
VSATGQATRTGAEPRTATLARTRWAADGSGWWALALPALLVGIALVLPLLRLTTPDVYVFDELYYAYTAGGYVAGEPDTYRWDVFPTDDPAIEWTHPPLAKLIIAGGILVFGDEPLGWRIASVIFGAAGVAIAYSLAVSLTGSRAIGVAAASLLMLDGLYFVESRTGMSNLFYLVFTNSALLALSRALAAPPRLVGPLLLATGACLGLAVSTKWSAVALIGLIGLAVAWRVVRLWQEAQRGHGAEKVAAEARWRAYLRWAPVALVLAPAAIYLAAYVHFFHSGYGWAELVELHRAMFAYHRNLGIVHDYSSPWWEWPLATRPVWYFADEGRRGGSYVFANGNPLLYWPMVPAVGWVAVEWWGRRPLALTVLAIGFFGQWLPWALSPRGTFVYHFLPSVPLGCVALAIVAVTACQRRGWQRWAAVGYGLAVLATFAFFYPLYTAVPLTAEQVDLRMWWASWR